MITNKYRSRRRNIESSIYNKIIIVELSGKFKTHKYILFNSNNLRL